MIRSEPNTVKLHDFLSLEFEELVPNVLLNHLFCIAIESELRRNSCTALFLVFGVFRVRENTEYPEQEKRMIGTKRGRRLEVLRRPPWSVDGRSRALHE